MLRLLVLVVVVEVMRREKVVGTKAGLCRNGPAPAAAASGTIMEQAQTPPIIVIRVGHGRGVIAIAEVGGECGDEDIE